MGLLDKFMANPATIMGLSVLSNQNQPAQGLLQGALLQNRLQGQRGDLQMQQMQMAALLKEQEKAKLQQTLMGRLTQPSFSGRNLTGAMSSGQPVNTQSILQRNPMEAANQMMGAGMVGEGMQLYNAATPNAVQTTEFERLDRLVMDGSATPGQIDRWKKLKDASSGQSIKINVPDFSQKEIIKADASARDEFINERAKTLAYVDLSDSLLRKVLEPGATIGTVGSLLRGTDVVRSQAEQLMQNPGTALSELSSKNRAWVEKSMQSGDILSDEMTLAYALAGAREGGKLTDRDVEAARETTTSGSIEQFGSKLLNTRKNVTSAYNRKAEANYRGRDNFKEAFAQLDTPEIYGADRISSMSADQLMSMKKMGKERVMEMLSDEEWLAFQERAKELFAK